jgi:hypothetical protein
LDGVKVPRSIMTWTDKLSKHGDSSVAVTS